MKKPLILLLLLICFNYAFSQKEETLKRLVSEGHTLIDSEDYKHALVKFDSALDIDKNNFDALKGKVSSLMGSSEYYKTVDLCEMILKKFKHEQDLRSVYLDYANALNDVRRYKDGEKMSDRGIELYPNDYRFYFTKGACLSNDGKDDESLPYYEKVVSLDSGYSEALALSNFTIGRIQKSHEKNVQALLALCRYIEEQPRSNRAKYAMNLVKEIMEGNTKKNKDGGMTIYISTDMLGDTTKGGSGKPNDFSSTALILATMGVMSGVDTMLHQNAADAFMSKFKVICSSLKENQAKGSGMYWNYYGAYFIEMLDKDYLETFANIAMLSSEDSNAEEWVKANKDKIDEFYKWSGNFTWKR